MLTINNHTGFIVVLGVFTELCLVYIFLEKIYTCFLGYFC